MILYRVGEYGLYLNIVQLLKERINLLLIWVSIFPVSIRFFYEILEPFRQCGIVLFFILLMKINTSICEDLRIWWYYFDVISGKSVNIPILFVLGCLQKQHPFCSRENFKFIGI